MSNLNLYHTMLDYVKKQSVKNNNLKEELKLLENKEKYFRRMSLQQQANISTISDMSRIWELSSDDDRFNDKVLSKMESLKSQCELVSANQEITAKMQMDLKVFIADDSDEENVVETNKKKDEDIIVQKQWHMEGKVDEISYVIVFDTSSSSENQDEFEDEIIDITLSAADKELEVFRQSVISMGDMQTFTLQLHSYQLLLRERVEAVNELEDYENMEVQQSADSVQFLFVPVKDHELKISWKVVWDSQNSRFKNEIWIDCTDDVVARFSQKEDAFPFLKRNKLLQNKKQVIQFFGYFVDDLLESTLDK